MLELKLCVFMVSVSFEFCCIVKISSMNVIEKNCCSILWLLMLWV